jgi:hypothetical protein
VAPESLPRVAARILEVSTRGSKKGYRYSTVPVREMRGLFFQEYCLDGTASVDGREGSLSQAEVEAAKRVIAEFDMRNCTTLAKCEELARKVLEAAEKARGEKQ